jgi:hypothetical protein
LIDSYKELNANVGADINTDALENAYNLYKATGDMAAFEKEKEKAD